MVLISVTGLARFRLKSGTRWDQLDVVLFHKSESALMVDVLADAHVDVEDKDEDDLYRQLTIRVKSVQYQRRPLRTRTVITRIIAVMVSVVLRMEPALDVAPTEAVVEAATDCRL